jgi:putative membrane protein
MMYWNGHMTAAGWIIAILWTVIIFALIAGAIYWLASALGGRSRSDSGIRSEGSAREILDRRLAKGELTVEQYRELREAIGGETPQAAESPPSPSQPASAPG